MNWKVGWARHHDEDERYDTLALIPTPAHWLVPGLLQSGAYARAVFEGTIPLRTDDELETQLAARLGLGLRDQVSHTVVLVNNPDPW